jgi:hypothetical protein
MAPWRVMAGPAGRGRGCGEAMVVLVSAESGKEQQEGLVIGVATDK